MKISIELRRKSDYNTKAKQIYRDLRDDGLATSQKIVSEILVGEKTSSFLEYAKQRTQAIYDAGSIRN